MLNIDEMSLEEIFELQNEKLKLISTFAQTNPHINAAITGLSNLSLHGLSALKNVSVLHPTKLAENSPPQNLNFVCDAKSSGVVLASGGTSGKRKTVFHSWEYFEKVMQMGARGLIRRLGQPPKKIANCFLPGSLWGGFVFGNGVAQYMRSQLFALGRPSLEELSQTIRTYKIDCFFSSPSFAYSVLLSPDIKISDFDSLTSFCYVGESPDPEQIKKINARFPNIKIHSLAYTANETGTLGYQCKNQSGGLHHIHEDYVCIEVVNPQTLEITPEGIPGEILVTTLENRGTPLFRYRIGDVAINKGRSCSCGSKTLVIDLLGRANTSANICGTIISLEYLLNIFNVVTTLTESDIQIQTSTIDGKLNIVLALNKEKTRNSLDNIKEIFSSDPLINEIKSEHQCARFGLVFLDIQDFKISKRTGKKSLFIDQKDIE